MTKAQRAESKAVRDLNRVLTADVGTRFWPVGELEVYLAEVVRGAGFNLVGDIRALNGTGDMSVRVAWPGGSDRYYLNIHYMRRPSGHIAATAGLGRF